MSEVAAWEDYWRENRLQGCIPDSPSIRSVVASCWREFALQLPKRARVLDLGTGAGAVLDELARTRRDLNLQGVDSAALAAPGRYSIACAGMESLPFPDSAFDAVCSQFGFEYGEPHRTVGEVARVLAPKGSLQFLIHHRQGPLLPQNRARRDAIEWAIEESGMLATALRLADARRTVPIPTSSLFGQAVETARMRFPSQPVAAEIMMAIAQITAQGERQPPSRTTEALSRLRNKATHEISILGALERAAQDEAGIERTVELLGQAGLQMSPPVAVNEPQTKLPFCWLVRGSNSGGGRSA